MITSLFEAGAVLLTRATSQIHGRSALAEVIIDHLREGGGSVAAPQLVMQSGRLALDPFWHTTSVARQGPDGWHYMISRLDR